MRKIIYILLCLMVITNVVYADVIIPPHDITNDIVISQNEELNEGSIEAIYPVIIIIIVTILIAISAVILYNILKRKEVKK